MKRNLSNSSYEEYMKDQLMLLSSKFAIKSYKRADLDKANKYNEMAIQLHGVDLRDRYHAKLAKKEENAGMFGLGKTKKLKYG